MSRPLSDRSRRSLLDELAERLGEGEGGARGEPVAIVAELRAREADAAALAVIDRTTEFERVPFLDRVQSTRGIVNEMFEMHRRIVEGQFLPRGDLADRFSLLAGVACGHMWKLEDRLGNRGELGAANERRVANPEEVGGAGDWRVEASKGYVWLMRGLNRSHELSPDEAIFLADVLRQAAERAR